MTKNLLLLFVFLFFCCKTDNLLDSTFENIISDLGEEKVEKFSSKEEKKAVAQLYMTYGVDFRNKYFANNLKSKNIIDYFRQHNINDIHSISYIIFSSLHRKLNNRPLKLEQQIDNFNKLSLEELNCKKSNNNRAEKYLEQFKINDTITVRMQIRNNNAIENLCIDSEINNWKFNNINDLLITGEITEKGEKKLSIKLKVLRLNKTNIKVLTKDIKLRDTIDLDLRYNIIERVGNVPN